MEPHNQLSPTYIPQLASVHRRQHRTPPPPRSSVDLTFTTPAWLSIYLEVRCLSWEYTEYSQSLLVRHCPAAQRLSLTSVRPSAPMSELEQSETFNDKYIVLYDFRNLRTFAISLADFPESRSRTHLAPLAVEEAKANFTTLLEDLESVGLHIEVRPGFWQTILVFVKAPREVLGNAVYKER